MISCSDSDTSDGFFPSLDEQYAQGLGMSSDKPFQGFYDLSSGCKIIPGGHVEICCRIQGGLSLAVKDAVNRSDRLKIEFGGIESVLFESGQTEDTLRLTAISEKHREKRLYIVVVNSAVGT
ncbi:MAG: hypothetical protein ABIJ92_04210 [Candidatus Aenigmatarchaeota archaeon]